MFVRNIFWLEKFYRLQQETYLIFHPLGWNSKTNIALMTGQICLILKLWWQSFCEKLILHRLPFFTVVKKRELLLDTGKLLYGNAFKKNYSQFFKLLASRWRCFLNFHRYLSFKRVFPNHSGNRKVAPFFCFCVRNLEMAPSSQLLKQKWA